MLVVLANHIPPAVRGRMKLWFIEARPNVFISGVKDSVADDIVEYLYEHCPVSSGIMVFKKINEAPGYKIYSVGETKKQIFDVSGLQLILEKIVDKV